MVNRATKRGTRRRRRISRIPADGARNYYVVDSNFLANKFIKPSYAPAGNERRRIEACREWWAEIDAQLNARNARVYVPDVCIAEAFKVLAKKYYRQRWFRRPVEHKRARDRLSKTLHIEPGMLKAQRREIRYHDVETSRDIIIAVDRFYEVINKTKIPGKKKAGQTTAPQDRHIDVQVADLLLLATAKHLMDFFDLPKSHVHIVTLDRSLRTVVQSIAEIPNTYDPTLTTDAADRIFG